jgi:uncharacterized damage-inducible protein DinB
MTDDALRFPIGRFARPAHSTPADRASRIERLATLPQRLHAAVEGLDAEQLATPYRDGGWNTRQVVFHVGDSHVNALVRLKLALTQERPTIQPYDEDAWVRTGDATTQSIRSALQFVEVVQERFVAVWKGLVAAQFDRVYVHPQNGESTLDQLLALYAWHGDHHLAHVTGLRSRRGW